jgi:RNA polymerase sigma-70 factor, ECF subfamily
MESSASIRVAVAGGIATAGSEAGGESSMTESVPMHQRMDEAAFRAFYGDTAPKLRSYLRRASGNAALADDILQETFLRFLRADLPVMERLPMKAYLYRTASSVLVDHWRKLKRERRWSLESFFGGGSGKSVENAGQGSDTLRLFASLKPAEQMLLWLAYVEGLDHSEVALAMQVKEKSVRVLLFRARKKLAGLLTERGIGPRG